MPVVRLIEERRFEPPREVEVEHNGQWWPARQSRWLLCDDGNGWRAAVEWAERYDWGLGKHATSVPPERVRPVGYLLADVAELRPNVLDSSGTGGAGVS